MSVVILAMTNQPAVGYRGRWIYCGQNYLDLLRWEQRLGAADRLSFLSLIPVVFLKLRSQFVDWTSKLGETYGNSLDWWITPLAARNTMQTPIFLHLCYLHILLESLREELQKGCLIVCEDWFLLKTLEFNLEAEGFRVKRMPLWWLALGRDFAVRSLKIGARWLRALALQTRSLIAARLTARSSRPPSGDIGDRQVLIHTCVDEDCLGSDGKFRDRYFSSLSNWLVRRGYRVTTIPWLYNINRPVSSAYRWFRENQEGFLIIDDYVRFRDFPGCILCILRSGLISHNNAYFGKYRVAPLLTHERMHNISSADLIKFLLYEQALTRWFREGNRCDIFIDMFENMASERAQLKTVRQRQPAALSVGYQHAPVPNELIGYSVTSREWATGIFPSRIVSHGRSSAEFLAREGFPAASVVEGPALRYTYLVDEEMQVGQASTAAVTDNRILVLLPAELMSAMELLARILGARDTLASESVDVVLKVHPMMPMSQLVGRMRIARLPDGWRWGGLQLTDWMSITSVDIALPSIGFCVPMSSQ